MDVVCTAGHVDHGKSALVRALTGMEPDRFDEEQRRGLTIDLGFAWTTIGNGDGARTVAFVDLPGHERFIANMLAGAGPVEAALLVVAADEGWKPQTQEHMEILDLLEISTAVVAVTKADAVDGDALERTTDEVSARLRGSSIDSAEIVTVSALTGAGLDDVSTALLRALASGRPAQDRGMPRLWIDRSFTVRGAGTVVTGTLVGGGLAVGEDVVVRPTGLRGRVRGLQSLQEPVDTAGVGDRVAVNVAGIDRSAVQRGDTLTHPAATSGTADFEAWLRVVGGHDVGRRGAWHLHAGSGQWPARLRPLRAGRIAGEGYARIQLDTAAPLEAGDRFVLRDSGRRATVAGGVVVDALSPRVRGPQERTERLIALGQRRDALRRDDRDSLLVMHVRERGVASRDEAAAAAGLLPPDADEAARVAGLVPLGPSWAHAGVVAAWSSAVVDALARHHRAHPLERVAPRDVATAAAVRAGAPESVAAHLLALLVQLGRVVADGPGVRHPDHRIRLDPEQERARDALLELLDAGGFAPPPLEDAAAHAGASQALVRELQAAGTLVALTPSIAVTADAVDQAAQRLRELAKASGPFTAAQAKEALGTTRKYAVPLLEELDRRGITRRDGDIRHIR